MIVTDIRMKRLFDVAGALGGLVFFGPAMAVAAAAILLENGVSVNPGPR